MNTTLRFDRCVLVKELNEKFKQIGETFEVANVSEDSFLLRSAKTKVAVGAVSLEDFDKHFVYEENFKGWTDWQSIVGFDEQTNAVYKTNLKKVRVKFPTSRVCAEACCCRDDDFNLSFGIHLAYLRCLNKAREKQRAELSEKMKIVEHEIAENKHIIKQMVNSID